MTVLLVTTLVSLVLAIVMSAVAWRAAREERRRSEARVATLAADIHGAVAAAGGRRVEAPPLHAVRPSPPAAADLFTTAPSTASSRSVVVVGIGLFVFATAAALAVVFSGSRATTANPPGPTTPASPTSQTGPPRQVGPARPAAVGPLDLVALGHERDGDRLTVRGVVRNPSGVTADHLTAVVFLFDRHGDFLSSGRAALDAALPPGGESGFTVTVPGARDVARYRVSFRTDTAVVPHVDKRHAE